MSAATPEELRRLGPQLCECCERELQVDRITWLELDQRDGRYVDPKKVTVPEDESQGAFPFGSTCARNVLKNGGRIS